MTLECPVVEKRAKLDNFAVDVEKYRKALEAFEVPEDDKLVKRPDNNIRQHPVEDVEGYFEWVTKHGKPAVPWDVIRPAFLWKIKFVMMEMIHQQNETKKKDEDKEEVVDFGPNSPLKQAFDFIMEKAEEFNGAPFTWQRICELLHTPTRHYKKAEKYLRALDKTINVVTTITESGRRMPGTDWQMPEEPSDYKIEQSFFNGKVDEVDGEDLWDPSFPASSMETKRPALPVVKPPAEPAAESAKSPEKTEETQPEAPKAGETPSQVEEESAAVDMSNKPSSPVKDEKTIDEKTETAAPDEKMEE